ncbi:cholesterol 24-hydroxylase-like [Actinia tenebrosa]|uniref:Cholesterol 24-hydroxylase n=1 Tax=Actinia tenebrosa TaxID=6105 RepID=A0A6P8HMZ7_ACTTE|nr:cholesterol 24-hydroxylase-like [Actinia tenebrosa]
MSFLYAIFVTLLAILLVVASYALYIVHRRKKFSHIPGPRVASFFSGNLPDLRNNLKTGRPSDQIFLDWHKMYGKVICTWFYHSPFLSIADPDIIKELLITKNLPKSKFAYDPVTSVYGKRCLGHGLATESDHQKWSKRRKIFNPAFHRVCLKDMMKAFNSSADLFIKKLLEKADGKTEVVMTDEFARATLDVLCKVAFGTDLNIINDPNCKFTKNVTTMLDGMETASFHPFGWMNPLNWPYQSKVRSAIDFIRETGKKIIEVRQLAINHGEQVPNDILQHILAIAEEDPTADIEDMLDEFVTFFVAGHETTANKLSFCVMELADHSEILEELVQEVFEVLGDRTTVHFDDLAKMHHMGEVLKETLRLYPSATGTVRVTEKDEMIGGKLVPAGTTLMFSSYITGRYPEYWPNAEDFNPLRFEDMDGDKRSHFTYFPFSVGPRNCIGQHFAQIEAKVILSRFIQTFKFRLVPGQTKQITEKMTIRPRDGVICTLVPRHKS